jgi:hypothetical protein
MKPKPTKPPMQKPKGGKKGCWAMAKAKWTGWIAHVPGQEVPPGFEIKVETINRHGVLKVGSGVTSRETVGHGCWHAKDQYGPYTMITRYKLRVIEDEANDDARVVRKIKELA